MAALVKRDRAPSPGTPGRQPAEETNMKGLITFLLIVALIGAVITLIKLVIAAIGTLAGIVLLVALISAATKA